jgi:adenosylcobinamide kinase/adenosylcobinamide-phosphate guanylyltransferase
MAESLGSHFTLPRVSLVLGGASSGKSSFAEQMIESVGDGIYVATAEVGDDEMAERIRRHQVRRGATWTTVEEPLDLVATLERYSSPLTPILVDCLTLWLSNVMAAGRDVGTDVQRLVEALAMVSGPVVLVSNEVGLGVVPSTSLGRSFRDHAGTLNQAIAGLANFVVFIAAGLPLVLKDVDQ